MIRKQKTGHKRSEASGLEHGQEKAVAVPTEKKVESSRKATAARVNKRVNVRIGKHKSLSLSSKVVSPGFADTEMEEAGEAVFSSAAERIIFTRALSDIASEDVETRADAARAMASIDHELSVRALVTQMAHEPSPQVRQECIKALTTLGKEEGLAVIEYALSDESASVRLAAVQGLYHLAGAESAPILIHMFSDESEGVRRRAASCVGWLGQEKLAVELLPLLTDSSVSVRRAAAEAIGNLRSRQLVSVLIEHLNDPEKSVRKAVLGAIETITGKKMKEPFPSDERSLQRLIARWSAWWKEELLEQ